MRLLILSNNAEGLYLFRKELIQSFFNNGHEVIIAIPKDKKEIELYRLGCTIYHVDLERRGKNPFNDFKLLLEYIRIIRYVKPEIIFTYTTKPNLYGGLASRILREKYCVNITGLGTAIENRTLLSKVLLVLYREATKKAECILYQNSTNKKIFEEKGIKGKSTFLLPGSGVNLSEYYYTPMKENNEVDILFVGRIMKEKGIEELLAAIPRLKKKYQNLNFHLVGAYEKEYEKEYRPILERMQKEGLLNYYGYSDKVLRYTQNATAVIQPSWQEGMSNVLLQAAAVGRIVLGSNIPGCKEIIEEGKNGYTFEIKNSYSLEEAIDKMMKLSMEEKIQMGKYSRQKVEKEFDRNIIIEQYQKLIKNLEK